MPEISKDQGKVWESLYLQEGAKQPPTVLGNQYLIGGEIRTWTGKVSQVNTPIYHQGPASSKISIGSYGMLTEKEAIKALDAACKAWDNGRGAWPQMTTKGRIAALEKFVKGLKAMRDQIVELVMWEICKNFEDAQKEVDRTIGIQILTLFRPDLPEVYVVDTIQELKNIENRDSTFLTDAGITGQIRRAPLGVVLCAGPFNYPFNETYTTLIPSLIMGNCVVMKLPRVGVACHFPTLTLFRDCFPAGVVNVISGSGRETMPPLMKSGRLQSFAFIGTSSAADELLRAHPKPHQCKAILGLEAKNPAIILPDADIEGTAVPECVLGSLSYNGQRCTAIKIILVHESVFDRFVDKFCETVDALPMGLPWVAGVKITPLPEENKPGYIVELVEDALKKGAKIANKRGLKIDRTFVAPTVLTNVNRTMRIFNEEQFGPLVPIVSYKDISEVYDYLAQSQFGQQAAVFGKTDTKVVGSLIDYLVNQVSRVNINCQCQRGPDTFPFTGRKDSAIGTLSISDALRAFSIRSVVATKVDKEVNREILQQIIKNGESKFLRLEHLF